MSRGDACRRRVEAGHSAAERPGLGCRGRGAVSSPCKATPRPNRERSLREQVRKHLAVRPAEICAARCHRTPRGHSGCRRSRGKKLRASCHCLRAAAACPRRRSVSVTSAHSFCHPCARTPGASPGRRGRTPSKSSSQPVPHLLGHRSLSPCFSSTVLRGRRVRRAATSRAWVRQAHVVLVGRRPSFPRHDRPGRRAGGVVARAWVSDEPEGSLERELHRRKKRTAAHNSDLCVWSRPGSGQSSSLPR